MSRAIVIIVMLCGWQTLATNSRGDEAPKPIELNEFAAIPCPNGVHFETAPYCFTPDGKSLLFPRGKTIEIRNVSSAQKSATWVTADSARPEGRYSVWTQIALSRNGQWLATGNDDGVVQVWNAAKGEYRYMFAAGKGEVHGLAISDDGHLAVVTDKQLRFSEVESGQALHTIQTKALLRDAAFLPDSPTLATVNLGNAVEKTVVLWDAKTGKESSSIANVNKHWGARHLSLSQDGQFLVGTIGTTEFLPMPYIYSWDLKAGRELPRLEPDDVEGVLTKAAISPDGKWLASVGYTKRLVIRDRQTGQRLAKLDLGRAGDFVELIELVAVKFSPSGGLLAVGVRRAVPAKEDALSYTSESEIRLVEVRRDERGE